MTTPENVVKMPALLERLADRAIKATRAYEAGIAKQSAGRTDAIAAVIEYGNALLEGRIEHKNNDKAFGQWVVLKGLDQIRPFDDQRERTAAMKLAENSTHENFLVGCPRTRPNDILTWWRDQQRDKNVKVAKRKARPNKVEAVAEVLKAKTGKLPDRKTLAKAAGVNSRNADNAIRVAKAVEEAVAETKAEARAEIEDAVLAASAKFTKAQDQHIQAKLRMLSKQQEKAFDERVRLAVLERNNSYRADLEQLQREASKKKALYDEAMNKHQFIFTEAEFTVILTCLHPDNVASKQKRDHAFTTFNLKKLQLIGKK